MRQAHFMQDTPCTQPMLPCIIRRMGRPKKKKTKVPNYFRQWRDHLGLNQDQAAERTGWSQETISRLESGKTDATLAHLFALAHAYGCEPGALLGPPKPPPNELAAYVMTMSERKRKRALKLLKAAEEDDSEVA